MINRIINTFKDAGAGAFFREVQEAADSATRHIEQATAKTNEYIKMEEAGAVALSKSRKPEQVVEACSQSIKARQELAMSRTKDVLHDLSEAGTQMVHRVEVLSKEVSAQTTDMIDSAFISGKKVLILAEQAAKGILNQEAKRS